MLSEPADDEDNDRDDQGGEALSDASPTANNRDKKKGKGKGSESFPGGGRRGVSSGLSTVVKRGGASTGSRVKVQTKTKEKWWKDLGGGGRSGSKGSLWMKVG